MECIEGMKKYVNDSSIDMIFCDLPYGHGKVACKWNSIIPLDLLWEQYERVIKPNGAIVLTASQPFTSELIMSRPEWFKFEWIWQKSKASNFVKVKTQPLRNHEQVLVFCKGKPIYNPQMTQGEAYKPRPGKKKSEAFNEIPNHMFRNGSADGLRYPKTIQYFKTAEAEGKVIHPNQKPIALAEYFIHTYSNESDLILDNCFGSGSFIIGAINTNRNYIGFEQDKKYFDLANEMIANIKK